MRELTLGSLFDGSGGFHRGSILALHREAVEVGQACGAHVQQLAPLAPGPADTLAQGDEVGARDAETARQVGRLLTRLE